MIWRAFFARNLLIHLKRFNTTKPKLFHFGDFVCFSVFFFGRMRFSIANSGKWKIKDKTMSVEESRNLSMVFGFCFGFSMHKNKINIEIKMKPFFTATISKDISRFQWTICINFIVFGIKIEFVLFNRTHTVKRAYSKTSMCDRNLLLIITCDSWNRAPTNTHTHTQRRISAVQQSE